jgi:tripartite-type tricarboxylate transporter receptor subunit TctC
MSFTSKTMQRRNFLERALLAGAMAAAALVGAQAQAQDYPTKPIVLVLPYPAGGSVDVMGRAVARRLSAVLKQSVVPDNKLGAGGLIGATQVAKAAPDGYTLLLSSSSTHSLAPALRAKMPYDPIKDFAPIIAVGNGRSVLLVADSMPVKDVKGLIAYMKGRGTANTFGTAGVGTIGHLNGEAFKRAAGVELTHVPYKGTTLAVQDLIGGRLTMMTDSVISAQALLATGKVRALAMVDGTQRSAVLPDLPTLTELGIPPNTPLSYFGLWAPAGTPAAVIQRLNAAMNTVLALPEMRSELAALGADPGGGTSAAFAERIASDTVGWAQLVKHAGIQPE